MWWAFALNFGTGVLLFMADATTKAGQWMFYLKLGMIALAFVVTTMVSKRLDTGVDLRTLAILSLLLWTAAIIAGRLLAYQ